MQPLENKALSRGIIIKSAPLLAEIMLRKSQELTSSENLIIGASRSQQGLPNDEIYVQDIKFLHNPDLLTCMKSWHANYNFAEWDNLVRNAAVLRIEGYYTKHGERDIRSRWYRRDIYPDGEDNIFVDQDGNCRQQDITYKQTSEGLLRTTNTYELPRQGTRQLRDEQTELLPSDKTPLRTHLDRPNGFRTLDDITPAFYEIPTYQPNQNQ